MRHAGPAALDALEPLLEQVRAMPALKERSRGVFYCKGKSFLHFHEDSAGLFADLRAGADFTRHRVSDGHERARFLKLLRATLIDA